MAGHRGRHWAHNSDENAEMPVLTAHRWGGNTHPSNKPHAVRKLTAALTPTKASARRRDADEASASDLPRLGSDRLQPRCPGARVSAQKTLLPRTAAFQHNVLSGPTRLVPALRAPGPLRRSTHGGDRKHAMRPHTCVTRCCRRAEGQLVAESVLSPPRRSTTPRKQGLGLGDHGEGQSHRWLGQARRGSSGQTCAAAAPAGGRLPRRDTAGPPCRCLGVRRAV